MEMGKGRLGPLLRRAAALALCALALMTQVTAAGAMNGVFVYAADSQSYDAPKGLMDTQENILIPAEYTNVYPLNKKGDAVSRYAAVRTELLDKEKEIFSSLYAMFDEQGNALTDFSYNYITWFDDGLYLATIYSNNWESYSVTVLDVSGKALFTYYDEDMLFPNGKGYSYLPGGKDRLALLDKHFTEISSQQLPGSAYPVYANADGRQTAHALIVTRDKIGLQGVYSLDGKEKIPCKYIRVSALSKNLFALYEHSDSLCFISDSEGRPMTEAVYSSCYAYVHEESSDISFIEAAVDGQAVLLLPDGTQITQPGEYSYFDGWASPDHALAYKERTTNAAAIIVKGGEVRPLPEDVSREYRILDSYTIMTFASPNGTATANQLTNPSLYHTDSGKRIALDFETDGALRGGYGEPIGKDGYLITVIPEGVFSYGGGNTLSRVFDREGKPKTPVLQAAYTVMDGQYIIARKGAGNLALYGLVDQYGNEVLPFRYTRLSCADEDLGVFSARQGAHSGYVDLTGRWIHKISAYARLED